MSTINEIRKNKIKKLKENTKTMNSQKQAKFNKAISTLVENSNF